MLMDHVPRFKANWSPFSPKANDSSWLCLLVAQVPRPTTTTTMMTWPIILPLAHACRVIMYIPSRLYVWLGIYSVLYVRQYLKVFQFADPMTSIINRDAVDFQLKNLSPTGIVWKDNVHINLFIFHWTSRPPLRIQAFSTENVTIFCLNRVLHSMVTHWTFMTF